jgi:hypothetical protein
MCQVVNPKLCTTWQVFFWHCLPFKYHVQWQLSSTYSYYEHHSVTLFFPSSCADNYTFFPFPSTVVFVDISEYKAIWDTLPICDNKWILFFLSPITLKFYNLLMKIFWHSLALWCSSSKRQSSPHPKEIHWETTEKEQKNMAGVMVQTQVYSYLSQRDNMAAVKLTSFQMLR